MSAGLENKGELIMYRILYKGFNGGFSMSDEMDLETAKEYKQKYLNMGYTQVFIIQIVE